MIRPLMYCENAEQVESSIHTIKTRIQELVELENSYTEKLKELKSRYMPEQGSFGNQDYGIHEK
ncbi:hypothetical protein EDC17_104324 [Sphingobacterium alimentarium]|uniref:Uncharacterized protein n=1 Tax=Sphingobacterium alimentarium TaxID=797292 RepID=A0A4V2VTZ2_9SPHI|nr:hypothetical protein [Sphingobacterium alimentarium]TCV09388.1 hypothetical protein EDC17_104324 [Sphingobacterium alimentarium]